jgi:hypothetical protein
MQNQPIYMVQQALDELKIKQKCLWVMKIPISPGVISSILIDNCLLSCVPLSTDVLCSK